MTEEQKKLEKILFERLERLKDYQTNDNEFLQTVLALLELWKL